MNQLAQLSLLFTSALISASLITLILVRQLTSLDLVDQPNDRRMHKVVTPRGGGLAIVAIVIIGFLAFEYLSTKALLQSLKIIPVFTVIAAISFLDDLRTVQISIRLIIHLLCAGLAIFLFLYPLPLLGETLPSLADFILSTICLAGFLNIYNFLDGTDGITASESIHLSATILMLCYLRFNVIINVNFIIVVTTIILAGCLSFLMFNWPPAKIFFGDVGSISLGFLIGLCLLLIAASSPELFVAAIIASLYYLADGSLTILIRLINREKIWQPHLKHFFQRAIRRGMTPKQVVMQIILCNSLLMMLTINSLCYPLISVVLSIVVVTLTLINFAK